MAIADEYEGAGGSDFESKLHDIGHRGLTD
jgi:hypothetical protein